MIVTLPLPSRLLPLHPARYAASSQALLARPAGAGSHTRLIAMPAFGLRFLKSGLIP
jgi:hypothetical protein